MEEIGEAIVYRRRRHEEHASADDQARERAMAVRVWIAEAVGFIYDDKADVV